MGGRVDEDDAAATKVHMFVEGLLGVTERLLDRLDEGDELSMSEFLVVVASYAASVIEGAEMDAEVRTEAYQRLERVFRDRWVS